MTASSLAPVNGGTAESGEGTQTQESASAGLGQEQAVSTTAVVKPSQDETHEAPDASSGVEPSLPAVYGRNARSVAGGMRAGSISLIA